MSAEPVPHIAIIVTPQEIGEIAELVAEAGLELPADFQPAAWLNAYRDDLRFLATEAVKDVVFDALLFGLKNHPLLEMRRLSRNGGDRC